MANPPTPANVQRGDPAEQGVGPAESNDGKAPPGKRQVEIIGVGPSGSGNKGVGGGSRISFEDAVIRKRGIAGAQ